MKHFEISLLVRDDYCDYIGKFWNQFVDVYVDYLEM